jgi:hypothetical protein
LILKRNVKENKSAQNLKLLIISVHYSLCFEIVSEYSYEYCGPIIMCSQMRRISSVGEYPSLVGFDVDLMGK